MPMLSVYIYTLKDHHLPPERSCPPAHLNPNSLQHTEVLRHTQTPPPAPPSTSQCRDSLLSFTTLHCPLSTKLFTSPFFTPPAFACVDILCNLFDPPGYSPHHHRPTLLPSSWPCPAYRNSGTAPSKMLVSTSLTTVSGDV